MRYERAIQTDLVIPINVTGWPFPTIEWRNGTQPLMNNSRVTIGSTGSLTVNCLMPYDRGYYSLTLSNSVQTTTTYYLIFIQCEFHIIISLPFGCLCHLAVSFLS